MKEGLGKGVIWGGRGERGERGLNGEICGGGRAGRAVGGWVRARGSGECWKGGNAGRGVECFFFFFFFSFG